MRAILLLPALLAGCGLITSEGEQAEERFRIVSRHGTAQEKCDAARAVADAYLEDLDQQNYDIWDLNASLECTDAQLERLAR